MGEVGKTIRFGYYDGEQSEKNPSGYNASECNGKIGM